jgi:uncharacterized Zn-binding protein involved in type VI secretion
MGMLAAKQGDLIQATDIHIVMVGAPPVPTPLPHPFSGQLSGSLSGNVRILGKAAATVGSTASNTTPHFPTPAGTGFQKPPTNSGTILMGSVTVRINSKPAARHGDVCQTCNDPADMPVGNIVVTGGNVNIG